MTEHLPTGIDKKEPVIQSGEEECDELPFVVHKRQSKKVRYRRLKGARRRDF